MPTDPPLNIFNKQRTLLSIGNLVWHRHIRQNEVRKSEKAKRCPYRASKNEKIQMSYEKAVADTYQKIEYKHLCFSLMDFYRKIEDL